MSVVTRFAPSPTGDLHLGHAFAAAFARDRAVEAAGRFLVRIEDIDASRCREAFVERNLEDLRWLGIEWTAPPVRQSLRHATYAAALDRLQASGILYPCFCTRAEIRAEIKAAAAAPQEGAAEVGLYPGRCRGLSEAARRRRLAAGDPYALRLDAARALTLTGPLNWEDRTHGRHPVCPKRFGDVVLARKDSPASYHLAVVVDDAAQGVTLVTRGEDLLPATPLHRLLQALLGLPVPEWQHHRLCRDASGRRLAKRSRDLELRTLRARGLSAADVLEMAEAAAGFGDGAADRSTTQNL